MENSSEFSPLFEALDNIDERYLVNDTLVAAERDWANCLADAGFPGAVNPTQLRLRFGHNEVSTFFDRGRGWDWEAIDEPENAAALSAFIAQEAEIALADFDCRIAVDYAARHNTARYEVETAFIRDHQAALTALRDAVEQGQIN
jgi:hypothetical protein